MSNQAIFSLESRQKGSFDPNFFHEFVWYGKAFTFGNVKLTYLEGPRVKTKLTCQENAIFLKKWLPWFSSKIMPNPAIGSLEDYPEADFCLKINIWILVCNMFPHVPKHKTSWFWASETICIITTAGTGDFFKFLWHMNFFMISWKYACFPCYFWEDHKLSLSVSVENHSYIHFLASNEAKLIACDSRKLTRVL